MNCPKHGEDVKTILQGGFAECWHCWIASWVSYVTVPAHATAWAIARVGSGVLMKMQCEVHGETDVVPLGKTGDVMCRECYKEFMKRAMPLRKPNR